MAERVHYLYRVSTTKQVDHDELNQADIPVQRKACREFAKKMGWIIVGEGEQRFESHTDRLTNYIRYWQADSESQKTSIRTKTALSQMVLEGRFRGGKTPYGYESLKAEVLKAVQGKSALPMEVLNEMPEETRQRVLDTSRRVTELTTELENEHSKMSEMQSEFERIATWSEIFDSSGIATQKMICGYIIKRVTVYRDYQLSVEFNINIEQFLNGIDSAERADCYEQAMA